jgi:hypothetical protein
MSNLNRGSSIDASYQVSVHLAKRFQRRSFLGIDQYPLTIVTAKENYCFWLVHFYKSSVKLLGQMSRNLVGSIYGRSSVNKDFSFRPDPVTNMAAIDNSCFWLI